MGILKRVRRALRANGPAAKIVVQSERARTIADLINRGVHLTKQTSDVVAAITRQMASNNDPSPYRRYATVAEHFRAASSDEYKLAIWEALVREQQPQRILEIGTAYGLSGIAMANAQTEPNLVTVEFSEPQATLGPTHIRNAVGGLIEARKGDKGVILPELRAAGYEFQYAFHDGGHSGDGYVTDFATILPMLSNGSLFVVDDIAWDDSPRIRAETIQTSRRSCYEGWLELLTDGHVEGAVTVRGAIGILIVRKP